MNYLDPSEYLAYGLDATTPPALVAAASSMIDAHCRRTTLAVAQYQERLRLPPDRNAVRLAYLPLAALAPATTPIVSAQGRYSIPRRGEWPFDDLQRDVALLFGLPGAWTTIDVTAIDYFAATGEVILPLNIVGLWFSEVDIVYTAGLSAIPDPVKFACAQLVRNAQTTPALNVRGRAPGQHAAAVLRRHVDRSGSELHAGAIRGTEGGLAMTDGGIGGLAVVRAADAMLQALGGYQITIVFPLVAMADDPSAQLGLADPGVQQVTFYPVVVRSLGNSNTGPRRRLEFLISSTAVDAAVVSQNAASAQALFDSALGINHDNDLFHIEGVTTEYLRGYGVPVQSHGRRVRARSEKLVYAIYPKTVSNVALRERLIALNPQQTVTLNGTTRPAIIVAENELVIPIVPLPDAFYIEWGAAQPVPRQVGSKALMAMDCIISYHTFGTVESGVDRGRILASLDMELLGICQPPWTTKRDYAQAPSVDLGSRIWWTQPSLGKVSGSETAQNEGLPRGSEGVRLERSASLKVFFFSEVGLL